MLFAIAAASLTTRQPPYALVLAATPGLKLHDIIRNQFERSSPHLVAAAEQVMNDIHRTGHAPADMPRELAAGPKASRSEYTRAGANTPSDGEPIDPPITIEWRKVV